VTKRPRELEKPGFTIIAAAALLWGKGEDGVPAGVLSPLRKTARHKLTGGILVLRYDVCP
jgi:hypothetical protein